MKICITSEGNNLDSNADQRFGRCQFFIFVDTNTYQFEAIANQNINGTGGVGVQSGQVIAEKKAQVVLTGKVGPNASQTLNSAGIGVVLDVQGTVREVIDRFNKGELNPQK